MGWGFIHRVVHNVTHTVTHAVQQTVNQVDRAARDTEKAIVASQKHVIAEIKAHKKAVEVAAAVALAVATFGGSTPATAAVGGSAVAAGGATSDATATGAAAAASGATSILGTADKVGHAISPYYTAIHNAISDTLGIVKAVNNDFLKPIISPIIDTINSVKSLNKSLESDLHGGIKGLLSIPQDITNALTGVDASFVRSINALNASNVAVAKTIVAPAINDAASVGLKSFQAAFSETFKPRELDLTVKMPTALDQPPGEDNITAEVEKIVKSMTNQTGWWGDMLSGLWDILTSAQLYTSYAAPRSDVYSEMAYRTQQVTRLDPGTVQKLYGLGFITRLQAEEELVVKGYDTSRQDLLLRLTRHVFDAGTAVDLWQRSMITEPDLDALLTQLSYDKDQITAVKADSYRVAGVGEAGSWFMRGIISGYEYDKILSDNRYTASDAKATQEALTPPANPALEIHNHHLKESLANDFLRGDSIDTAPAGIQALGRAAMQNPADVQNGWLQNWQLMGVGFWTSAYYRKLIGLDVVFNAFTALNVPASLHQIVVDQQHTLIRLTYIASLIKSGLINDQQGIDKLEAYGYNSEDALLMLEYAKVRTRHSKNTTAKQLHDVSLATAKTLYDDKIITYDDLISLYVQHGYSESSAKLSAQLAKLQNDIKQRKADAQFIADMYHIGKLTNAAALSKLYDIGLSTEEVAHYEKSMRQSRARKQKIPAQAELIKMYKKGLLDKSDLKLSFVQSGYDDTWAQRLMDLYT